MAQIIELIYTTESRGSGTKEDRCRTVMQLYTKDGRLVAEYDPYGSTIVNDSALYSAIKK